MGLSSSQARLLDLTSRMHDIEYKAQNLEAQKLQMANESDQVYQTYENALNTQKMQLKTIGTDGSASYMDVTGDNLAAAHYVFEVVSGPNSGKVYTSLTTAATTAGTSLSDTTNGGSTAAVTNLVEAGFIVLVKLSPKADGTYPSVTNGQNMSDLKDSSNSTYSANVDYINETNVATDTNLQEVSDDTQTKKAEAKYEADMAKIDAKDKKFDTDIASLDNERTAIKTEIDTLKSVAKDNVDRTFKLFS